MREGRAHSGAACRALCRGWAKRDELIEAGFLAVLMHGGPAMMYMTPLLKALDEFGLPAAVQV